MKQRPGAGEETGHSAPSMRSRMGSMLGFWGTRTGGLVVGGFLILGVALVVGGPWALVGIPGLGLVLGGLHRRVQQPIDTQLEALRRQSVGAAWRTNVLSRRIGEKYCVQVFNHHKAASVFVRRILLALAQKNGLSYTLDQGRLSEVERLIGDYDIVDVRNSSHALQRSPRTGGLHVVRNPFAVVVSAYFSHLNIHATELKGGTWEALVAQRKRLQELDKNEGLHATIEFLCSTHFFPSIPGPLLAMESWDYDDERFVNVRMEDFVKAPIAVLKSTFDLEGLDLPAEAEFTFSRMAGGRRPGEVDPNSHFRSGDPNDWRNHLTAEHIAAVKDVCPRFLARCYPELLEEIP